MIINLERAFLPCQLARNAAAQCQRQLTRRPATAAADAFCKDKVSIPSKGPPRNLEGSATVTFLGAGGQAMKVECPLDTYILDAGLDAGVELPYTCRGGICGACVGKVVQGEIDASDIADLSFTLSDEEIEDGFALICMTRPKTDIKIETQSDWGYSLGTKEWAGATGKISGGTVDPLMGGVA